MSEFDSFGSTLFIVDNGIGWAFVTYVSKVFKLF